MHQILAGTGRADISPAPGTPHAGWGAQTHQLGRTVDMPLFVTALVLGDGAETVAIADVDIIHVSPEVEAQAVQLASQMTGILSDRIRVSHSHTHSGPNTFRLANITAGLSMVQQYIEDLPNRIAGAIWQACSNLRPVRMAGGAGSCDINVNRRFRTPEGRMVVGRNPEGAVDRTVRVLRFDDLQEHPVATVVHYACHPTIMGWENQFYTPDYPGVVRRTVEQQIGGTCLFLQGAAGNVGPRRGFTFDLAVYRHLGQILGLEAARVALQLEPLPRPARYIGCLESGAAIALYSEDPAEPPATALHVISRTVRLPVRSMGNPEQLDAEAAELRGQLQRLRESGPEPEIREANAKATQAGMRAERARLVFGRTHLERRLMGIAIGDVALVSTQGEPFIETSLDIEKQSPFRLTLFSGYSHGGAGYIPSSEAFEEGGYEVETSFFAPETARVLTSESVDLLRDLHQRAS